MLLFLVLALAVPNLILFSCEHPPNKKELMPVFNLQDSLVHLKQMQQSVNSNPTTSSIRRPERMVRASLEEMRTKDRQKEMERIANEQIRDWIND